MSGIGQTNSLARVQATDSSSNSPTQVKKTTEQNVPMQRDSISGLKSNLKNNRGSNNDIFFVGLNDTAAIEVKTLKKTTTSKITPVVNTSNYEIVLNNKKFNIVDTNAIKALNLSPTQTSNLQNFLINEFMFSITKSEKRPAPMTKEQFKTVIDKLDLPEKTSNELYDQLVNKTGPLVKVASGQTYNLNYGDDIADFSKSLGLPENQTKEVEKFLASGDISPVSKDELAQIVTEFAKAEKGGQIPSRLVISSHSDGKSYFGVSDKGLMGKLEISDLKELAKIMPIAASQIEDISVSACNGGHSSHLDQFKEVFPNLKTFMGYAGSAPGSVSGASAHLKKWEMLTRGDKQVLTPKDFQSFRKGENVSTWTEKEGFKLDNSKQIEKNIPEFVHSSEAIIEDYFNRDKEVKDNQHGELRTVYSNIQLVLGNNANLTPDDKKSLIASRDKSLRLLFFPEVSKKFNSTYALQIQNGYKTLGLKPTNFSTLSRAQTREEVQKYQNKVEALVNEMDQACNEKTKAGGSASDIQKIKDSYADSIKNAKTLETLLKDGLMDLSPNIIPEDWV